MPVDEAPEDDDDRLRQTYNFAPSYHGLVYRAEVAQQDDNNDDENAAHQEKDNDTKVRHKLQAMKWGLVPHWTKRAPDYSNQLKTINCRDDSLAQTGGMWNTMKQNKRCIIIAEGFYEWLKKNNGREKIPHFVKRKDGQLMCFAGLWDSVKYQGQDEILSTFTIITTSSNKQLNFLHNRMPVILDNGSDAIKTWLDPSRSTWSKELQSLLKPYNGELECYPVDRAVGKVGNNSPTFIVPVDSKENKKNIANFFSNQASQSESGHDQGENVKEEQKDIKQEQKDIKKEPDEDRDTLINPSNSEDNAPLPVPPTSSISSDLAQGIKREFPDSQDLAEINSPPPKKVQKTDHEETDETPHMKSPERAPSSTRKTRSAVSNNSAAKSSPNSTQDGSQKITSFFSKP